MVQLRRRWPGATRGIFANRPDLELSAWGPGDRPREVALLLPGRSCATLIIQPRDRDGVQCRVVTHIQTIDGRARRQSSPCNLGNELELERTLLISEVQDGSGWREERREALPLPVTTYGVLTRASDRQLVYGGENVAPVEGCVGPDLRACPPNVQLEPWQQCRACDRTELFFVPKPVDEPQPIPHEPECRNACEWPPNQGWINSLGELGLWRMKAKAADVAVVFSEMADCEAYAAERDRLTSTAVR